MIEKEEIKEELIRVAESYGFAPIPINKALKRCSGYMKLIDKKEENDFVFIDTKSVGILRYHIRWSDYDKCYCLAYDYSEGGSSGLDLKSIEDVEKGFCSAFRCHHIDELKKVEKQYDLFDFM